MKKLKSYQLFSLLALFTILISSCHSTSNQENPITNAVNPVDTIELIENFRCNGTQKMSNIGLFSEDLKEVTEVRKNIPIIVKVGTENCEYFSEVFNHSDIQLKIYHENCTFTKLSKYTYRLVVGTDFNEGTLLIQYVIRPHENVVLKSFSTPNLIQHKGGLILSNSLFPISE